MEACNARCLGRRHYPKSETLKISILETLRNKLLAPFLADFMMLFCLGHVLALKNEKMTPIYLSTISFNSLPTLKNGNFLEGTVIFSPVLGFRPV
jgi:hypothetical protein